MKPVRLDKLLANLGYGSRREVASLVEAGLVRLDGGEVARADDKVTPTPDLPTRLKVRGSPVDPPPGLILMLHKPLGVTCSHKEDGALVYDLLPERWRRRDPPISTVGRLDKETSGLLLMTDDGTLLHRIISPKAKIAKRYRVELDRPLGGDEAAIFASGHLKLEGEDKPLLPATLDELGPKEAWLTIEEGRYHQVRRMFAAVGNHVAALHRDRIGGLELPSDLPPGRYRLLATFELDAVFGTLR
ncbi:MAG: pseudouridine synthase [Caulobacteraceae bacterium]|nr:pseudouridine synthase [Caulobacteraceae bacterium]